MFWNICGVNYIYKTKALKKTGTVEMLQLTPMEREAPPSENGVSPCP